MQWQGTPLHLAAMQGHTDSVILLLASGADINMVDVVSSCNILYIRGRGCTY